MSDIMTIVFLVLYFATLFLMCCAAMKRDRKPDDEPTPDAHDMLERHLKKAKLSPDDKQDIITAERARRVLERMKQQAQPVVQLEDELYW